MAQLDRNTVRTWVTQLADMLPCTNIEEFRRYLKGKPEAKFVYPRRDLTIDDHWFCVRRYHDVVSDEHILEVYIGSHESGEEYMGYDRIDPVWLDAEGNDERRWELTRAYMRPRYRGRNYSLFMAELVIALAKKNKARSVVAFPRHVAMLITLLNYGFETMEGNYDETLHRIYRQGKKWYGSDQGQRRLYYAQEFRPFIQDGSFIMEKKVRGGLWGYLFEKI